ncbi:putative nuclease HARBI1 [Aphis craccivora]|uniref:Putative nuclease HARBI1 n=1 Tax=Aphis craccivora TaxID=307492 RepID=A0A6G0Y8D4_APHCR|nr:putative nuclease HARBI1 [Aphis craccivora]
MKFIKQEIKLTVENLDPFTSFQEHRHGALLPNTIRALIVGPSNCGKTNLIFTSLTNINGIRFHNGQYYNHGLHSDQCLTLLLQTPVHSVIDRQLPVTLTSRNRLVTKHYMDIDDYSDTEESDEAIDDFDHLAELVAFPRRAKIIRERPDHFKVWRDDEFLNRFRLNKDTNNAVTPSQKLLMTLRYYATGSFIATCADFAGIHKTTGGKIVIEVSKAIAALRPDFIHFPTTDDEIRKVKQDFFNIAKFPSCIGAIDCTHIKIRSPGGDDAEIFRNRKQFFSLNVQTICDSKLIIQNIVARWPGSSHDANIFRNSDIKQRFDNGEFKDCVLVADSGYSIQSYMITPMLYLITNVENTFNESQIRTRNPVERFYGVWKRRFPILSLGINVRNLDTVQAIIVASSILHNIVRQFGDDQPRVTEEQEHLIALTLFHQLHDINDQGRNQSIHRNRFLNYFNTLLST